MNVTITGAAGVHDMLDDYMEPILPKRMQAATKAGADVFKPAVKAEAARVSKRLARSVSVRKAKRERPATVLTFRSAVAFFRHWIIGGTKDHGPKHASALVWEKSGTVIVARHVRGMRPNPIIARVAARLESQAYKAIDNYLDSTEAK